MKNRKEREADERRERAREVFVGGERRSWQELAGAGGGKALVERRTQNTLSLCWGSGPSTETASGRETAGLSCCQCLHVSLGFVAATANSRSNIRHGTALKLNIALCWEVLFLCWAMDDRRKQIVESEVEKERERDSEVRWKDQIKRFWRFGVYMYGASS
jgi:hypothetical protein